MGRPKKFSRDGVLEKALPVFWRNGFAGTSVQDLEIATGVNKSGLYSEFKGKDDLFVASLRYYFVNRGGRDILDTQPLGWSNIERFMRIGEGHPNGQRGCFSVSSIREFAILPVEAHEIITSVRGMLEPMLIRNIQAENPKMAAESIAELAMVFFSGLCIEQNLPSAQASTGHKIETFMEVLRGL